MNQRRFELLTSNSLAFTVTGDPLSRDGVGTIPFPSFGSPTSLLNPDPYLRRLESGGVGVSVRGTHVLTPRLVLETALSNQWRKEENNPATDNDEVLFIDAPTGVWSGGSSGRMNTSTNQWTAGLKATWVQGQHELKAGVEYRGNSLRFEDAGFDIVWRFSDTSFIRQAARTDSVSMGNRISSLFVQDSWRIGSRVVFNYGLRWAREQLVSDAGDVVQTIDGYPQKMGSECIPTGHSPEESLRFFLSLIATSWFSRFPLPRWDGIRFRPQAVLGGSG